MAGFSSTQKMEFKERRKTIDLRHIETRTRIKRILYIWIWGRVMLDLLPTIILSAINTSSGTRTIAVVLAIIAAIIVMIPMYLIYRGILGGRRWPAVVVLVMCAMSMLIMLREFMLSAMDFSPYYRLVILLLQIGCMAAVLRDKGFKAYVEEITAVKEQIKSNGRPLYR